MVLNGFVFGITVYRETEKYTCSWTAQLKINILQLGHSSNTAKCTRHCVVLQTVWSNWLLLGLLQDDTSVWDGHESEGQCLPSGMFRVPTVQPQVAFYLLSSCMTLGTRSLKIVNQPSVGLGYSAFLVWALWGHVTLTLTLTRAHCKFRARSHTSLMRTSLPSCLKTCPRVHELWRITCLSLVRSSDLDLWTPNNAI